METDATLRQESGHLDATTTTQTVTWMGGFTGGVSIIFFDANNVAIGQTWPRSFGVDGSWFGRNKRTDYWAEDVDRGVAGRTARMEILHYWAPRWNAINNIVAHAVQVGQTADPLLKQLRDYKLIWREEADPCTCASPSRGGLSLGTTPITKSSR
jgi:hypothetical protein